MENVSPDTNVYFREIGQAFLGLNKKAGAESAAPSRQRVFYSLFAAALSTAVGFLPSFKAACFLPSGCFLKRSCVYFPHGMTHSRRSGWPRKSRSGNFSSSIFRYSLGGRSLALAVSTILYTTALALAPRTVVLNSQFLRPTANGRIAFSAQLLESWQRGSLR